MCLQIYIFQTLNNVILTANTMQQATTSHYWFRGYPLGPSGLGRWFKSSVRHRQCLQTVSYLWDDGLDKPRSAPVIGLRTPLTAIFDHFMDIPKTSPVGVQVQKWQNKLSVLKNPCVGLSASHGTVTLTHVLTVPVPRKLSSSTRWRRHNALSSEG